MRKIALLILLAFQAVSAIAQGGAGVVKGIAYDSETREPLSFVNILIPETEQGFVTELDGSFVSGPMPEGFYTLKASFIGYEDYREKAFEIKKGDTVYLELPMRFISTSLQAVVVQAAPFKRSMESPVSLRTLGATEIQRNPGSDNDISKVIQSMPGVTTTASFRNDLIIRGGAPNENRFFLDDIEIPVINHLVTQGASGGAFSIINANQLREVDYMSASFPANRGNALSSVFNFSLKDGRRDRLGLTATMGGTEFGLALEGPIGEKTTFLLSGRRSYRQYILQLLNFAFLPVYNDMTAKVKIQFDKKNELTLLGVGAIDNFTLNTDVGDNEVQRYLLDNLPRSEQSNYTAGAVYKRYTRNGYFTLVGSRSKFNNSAEKYWRNDPSVEENLILLYESREASNRGRLEYTWLQDGLKLNAGAGIEDIYGSYDVFNRIFSTYGPVEVDYESEIRFQQFGFFAQASKSLWGDRLSLTAGVRADGSNYNEQMRNPLDHLSGRLALSVGLTPTTTFTLGAANYFQLPPMMTLSYRDSGELDNQDVAQFIESRHLVAGLKWDTPFNSRFSVEGFLKIYPDYMRSLRDSISLAHTMPDFGVFGSFPVDFGSAGRAYGLELFYQQRLYRGFYGMMAYTLSWSEYKDKNGAYAPSSWDARHILNLTLGKRFNKKWEAGLNWRMQSPLPYTPFQEELSSLRAVWDVNNQGIRDYSQINMERSKYLHNIDLRVDRIYHFKTWKLNVYLDLENLTADSDSQQALILDRAKDANGNFTDDGLVLNPEAPYEQQRYRLRSIENAQGALIPTFGVIVEW